MSEPWPRLRARCNLLSGFALVAALSALLPAAGTAQSEPKPVPAPKRVAPKPTRSAPSPDPNAHPKTLPSPPQPKPSAEDELVVRRLELLILLDMMKDYALFYDDAQPSEKSPKKP
jgi:hypothetical protein